MDPLFHQNPPRNPKNPAEDLQEEIKPKRETVANLLDKFTNEMSADNMDNLAALRLEFHELLQHQDKLQVVATQNHPSTKELGKLSP